MDEDGNDVYIYTPGFEYMDERTFAEGGSLFTTNGLSLLWSNHDIYKKSDTTALSLAASEPAPVYE
jgi:hypothetical protein